MTDSAILAFTQAAHALTDMGSPAHKMANGTPFTRNGGRLEGAAQLYRERYPSVDWLRAGQSIRLEIAGFAAAFPNLARKHGNVETWAQKAISDFVHSYFRQERDGDPLRLGPGAESAARQCALGNPAACGLF